jgi:hypothetical protein
MKTATPMYFTLLPALLLAALPASASAQAPIQRDPFARPAAAVAAAAAASASSDPAVAPAPPAPPRLRAVMYEPGKSLVNIDGRILAVGDSFDDYRVTAIGERSATLTRRAVRSVIVIVLDQESSK